MSSIFGEEFENMFAQLDKLNEAAKPLREQVEKNKTEEEKDKS